MDILKKTRELGVLIQQTEEFESLQEAKKSNDEDLDLFDNIQKLNLLKLELKSLLSNEENDKKATEKKNDEIKKVYNEIISNENMKKYQEATEKFQILINKINTIIQYSANGADPMSCPDEEISCSGNCGGCSGCS